MSDGGKLVIVGAGGHAKVVVEMLRDDPRGYELVGATDAHPATAGQVLTVPVLGNDSVLEDLARQGVRLAFIALGDNRVRERLAEVLLRLNLQSPSAVSRSAVISPSAVLGAGVAVMPGAVINAEARVGPHSIVNSAAVVEHDCRIGAFVHIGPNATLAGDVRVGARSFIGAGATVIPGVTIGSDATIGAGACVIRDVPDGATVVGVPARPLPPGHR